MQHVSPAAIDVPARTGAAFVVRKGERFRIVSIDGHQICDFVAFNRHQPREKLSTGETVNFNSLVGSGSIHFTTGSYFWSNLQNPMIEIVEDQAKGVHDMLLAPCSSALYAAAGAGADHPNCHDNLTKAVEPYGLDYLDVPDPINLFQYSRPRDDGTIDYRPAPLNAGEHITLKALMDCLVAISACPYDLAIKGKFINGDAPSALRVEFERGARPS